MPGRFSSEAHEELRKAYRVPYLPVTPTSMHC